MLVDPFVLGGAGQLARGAARLDLARRASPTLPLIGYRNNLCSSYDAVFESSAAKPSFVFQSDDNTTIQGCVGAGLGYALVPRLTVDVDDPAIRILELRPAPPARRIGVAWSSTAPAAAEPSPPSSTGRSRPAPSSTGRWRAPRREQLGVQRGGGGRPAPAVAHGGGQVRRLAPRRWWARRPFLPVPDRAWLRFRMETQYGDPAHRPEPDDVVAWLEWAGGATVDATPPPPDARNVRA